MIMIFGLFALRSFYSQVKFIYSWIAGQLEQKNKTM